MSSRTNPSQPSVSSFKPTARQQAAERLLKLPQRHTLLAGGSRSGKTTMLVRAIAVRAVEKQESRHVILRLRSNAARASIALDTLPKVFRLCYPRETLKQHRTEGYFSLSNGSEIWIGGLDDQERVEKILGNEYATIFLNEVSQIPYASVLVALTRLAQVVDGLTQAASNAYVNYLATGTAGTGSTLTGDSAGGVVEIDAALKNRWDNYRLSPDTMWVGSQVANDLSKKILSGGSSAAQRFVFESDQGALGGGVMVRTYLNKFSMAGPKTIDIRVHPNMPAGTVLMTSRTLPYPLSNVGNVMQIRTRQDYYQIEWPPRARRYETGVYADEVLQH